MRRLIVLLLFLLLPIAAGLGVYALRPLPLPGTPFVFELKQGSSLTAMARQMHQAGLLEQEPLFIWFVRLLGKSGQLQAGSYALEQSVSPLELLRVISEGQVSQRRFGVIEGWTFRQMREALNSNPDVMHDSLSLSDGEILQRIGAPESQPEGLFFPDTYHFATGSSDFSIFRRAYLTMQRHLQEGWAAREANLPLQTPYQALILASIVEKETGTPSDRAMIAGVFINRMRIGMLLQTDPTVIYGLGPNFDGNLHKHDLQTDTPYNTYTRGGLTPTPIALPGRAALEAVLHPAKTKALYFVARGDGSSYFSSSLNEHNRAVNKYQK